MKKLFFLCLLLIGLVVACKKETTDPEPIKSTNNNTTPSDTMEKVIEIKTDFGSMYMWLYKGTPIHRTNFLKLADSGFFDGTTFHRCVPNFVIQGGDPNSKDIDSTNDGSGGPGYKIPAEINTTLFKHVYGAVGAARDNNPAKESNGSQFYIVLPKAGYSGLNGNYTVFGLILNGMEIADSIVKQPQNASNRPYVNITMDVNVVEKSRAVLRNDFHFDTFEK
ncbi:MAG: peptidylprolyl isomerase [Bacteroidia bacterium]|jgi:cyclophilin family peptidyl-prolyl cis-trans isomerase